LQVGIADNLFRVALKNNPPLVDQSTVCSHARNEFKVLLNHNDGDFLSLVDFSYCLGYLVYD